MSWNSWTNRSRIPNELNDEIHTWHTNITRVKNCTQSTRVCVCEQNTVATVVLTHHCTSYIVTNSHSHADITNTHSHSRTHLTYISCGVVCRVPICCRLLCWRVVIACVCVRRCVHITYPIIYNSHCAIALAQFACKRTLARLVQHMRTGARTCPGPQQVCACVRV